MFIVKDLEGFDTVESPNSRFAVCGPMGKPSIAFPSAKTMVNTIATLAGEVRDIVVAKIVDLPISLTGDGWKSRAGEHFYSLTVHVVDPEEHVLKKYTLACRSLDGRHNGER